MSFQGAGYGRSRAVGAVVRDMAAPCSGMPGESGITADLKARCGKQLRPYIGKFARSVADKHQSLFVRIGGEGFCPSEYVLTKQAGKTERTGQVRPCFRDVAFNAFKPHLFECSGILLFPYDGRDIVEHMSACGEEDRYDDDVGIAIPVKFSERFRYGWFRVLHEGGRKRVDTFEGEDAERYPLFQLEQLLFPLPGARSVVDEQKCGFFCFRIAMFRARRWIFAVCAGNQEEQRQELYASGEAEIAGHCVHGGVKKNCRAFLFVCPAGWVDGARPKGKRKHPQNCCAMTAMRGGMAPAASSHLPLPFRPLFPRSMNMPVTVMAISMRAKRSDAHFHHSTLLRCSTLT